MSMRDTGKTQLLSALDHADPATARRRAKTGLLSGIGAYLWWGLVPGYFKLLDHVPGFTIVSHRILWSLGLIAVLITVLGGWRRSFAAMRSGRVWLMLIGSTIMIATNWLTFIYAIQADKLLDASVGYFLAPLVNVLLGVVCLSERLRRGQVIALLLATAGVTVLTIDRGVFPWIALVLAGSFGVYGLLRKLVSVGPLIGLGIETALLAPIALAIVLSPATFGQDVPPMTARTMGLLSLAGIITATPLLLFADAARKLRMATIGFLQYIGPTVQFVIAVAIFKEPFSNVQLYSFILIWCAVITYSLDSLAAHRASQPRTIEPGG